MGQTRCWVVIIIHRTARMLASQYLQVATNHLHCKYFAAWVILTRACLAQIIALGDGHRPSQGRKQ